MHPNAHTPPIRSTRLALFACFLLVSHCAEHVTPTTTASLGGAQSRHSAPPGGGGEQATSQNGGEHSGGLPSFGSSSVTSYGGAILAGGTLSTNTELARDHILMHADFQNRDIGTYTQSMVSGDFSGTATWNNGLNEGRATIFGENNERFLRVTYVAGVYGPNDGGVQFLVPLSSPADELYLAYRVRFTLGFDFVQGGKLPGLVGGSHPTGCVTDTSGFSARMMWRPLGACVAYVYYPEKTNSCGDDFPYQIEGKNVTFVPGNWHRIVQRIRMNQPGIHNGILQAWFDGTLAIDNQSFIYRIESERFQIDALYFSTFFGGSDSTWAPATTQYVDYDDFVVSRNPIP